MCPSSSTPKAAQEDSTPDWMLEAIREAKIAEVKDEVPVGAVVVLENKIIGRGHNLRESTQDPCAHAELLAVQNAARAINSWRLNGAVVFVTLEPCPMCLGALQQARVEKVIYGAQDSKGGAISLGFDFNTDPRMNHRFETLFVPEPECARLLTDFFKMKRKQE